MDTPMRTLEWIQHGLVHATIAQKPYTMAYTGLRSLADVYKYKPANLEREGSLSTVPYFVDTGATLVTKENVAGFLRDQASTQPADEVPAQ
jgi:ribose transport system substrate-binding protein